MEWNCRLSLNFRRSARLKLVILDPGALKCCPRPFTIRGRLQEFINEEF